MCIRDSAGRNRRIAFARIEDRARRAAAHDAAEEAVAHRPVAIARQHVAVDFLDERAVHFGDADLQIDLQRRRGAQARQHLRLFADKRLDEAFGLGRIVGRLDRAGQQDEAVHRVRLDLRLSLIHI